MIDVFMDKIYYSDLPKKPRKYTKYYLELEDRYGCKYYFKCNKNVDNKDIEILCLRYKNLKQIIQHAVSPQVKRKDRIWNSKPAFDKDKQEVLNMAFDVVINNRDRYIFTEDCSNFLFLKQIEELRRKVENLEDRLDNI